MTTKKSILIIEAGQISFPILRALDMGTFGESISWMDNVTAIDAVIEILKQNGTLAI
jgi:hypothetical protein